MRTRRNSGKEFKAWNVWGRTLWGYKWVRKFTGEGGGLVQRLRCGRCKLGRGRVEKGADQCEEILPPREGSEMLCGKLRRDGWKRQVESLESVFRKG